MSNRSYLGLGGLLCAGLLSVAGCSSGDADAITVKGKYDTAALDAYMSDASDEPSRASGLVESSKPSDSFNEQSMESMFVSDVKPCDHANAVPEGVFGDWVGDIDMAEAMASSSNEANLDPDADPAMAEFGEEFAKAMAEMMGSMFSMSLCLREDHSFSAQMMMMPIEGSWKQKGDRIFLTPHTIMGFTEEDAKSMTSKMEESFENANGFNMEVTSTDFDQLELRVIENGNALTAIDPNSGGDQALVFRRK